MDEVDFGKVRRFRPPKSAFVAVFQIPKSNFKLFSLLGQQISEISQRRVLVLRQSFLTQR